MYVHVPLVSSNEPYPWSPAVEPTSVKLGESSPSTSLIAIVPDAVCGKSPSSPSTTVPVTVPLISDASSVPVIVTVIIWVELSVAV